MLTPVATAKPVRPTPPDGKMALKVRPSGGRTNPQARAADTTAQAAPARLPARVAAKSTQG